MIVDMLGCPSQDELDLFDSYSAEIKQFIKSKAKIGEPTQ